MEFQIAFYITLAALVGVVIYLSVVKKESNRYLTAYRPVKTERDKLREENASLQKRLEAVQGEVSTIKSEHKANKKREKTVSSPDEARKPRSVSELEKKLAHANTDIAKLRQENFDLRRDNKALLKDKQAHGADESESARQLVALRDACDQANDALARANARISELEKGQADAQKAKDAPSEAAAPNDDVAQKSAAALAKLEHDKRSAESALQAVRTELAEFKKGSREKLEEARQEMASDVRAFKEENQQLKRQLQQSKTRADNNHRIFLIARAQLMLVEKRLALFDASYKPVALGTSSVAIDETIKKFLTQDVRESRASAEVIERDRKINALVSEIRTLKKQIADAQNTSRAQALQDVFEENPNKTSSIETFFDALPDDMDVSSSKSLFSDFSFDGLIASKTDKESSVLQGLDLSALDEASWEAF